MTSENKTDDRTGIKHIILRGKQNHIAWSRAIKFEIELRGLRPWFEGTISVPPKPIYNPSTTPTNTPPKTENGPEIKNEGGILDGISMQQNQEVAEVHEFQNFDVFKWHMKQYEKLSKEEREAKKLLFERIDHIFIPMISNLKTVAEQATALEMICGQGATTTLEDLYNRFETISLKNYNNVQEYINKHISTQADIMAMGGTCTDAHMKAKLVRGLTPEWALWKEIYRNTQDTQGPMELLVLMGRLVSYEQNFKMRKSPQPSNKQGSTFFSKTNKDTNTTKSVCPKCKKTNHTVDKCWFEHPELAPWNSKEQKKSFKKSASFAKTDVDQFMNNLADTHPGMKNPTRNLKALTDSCSQTIETSEQNEDDEEPLGEREGEEARMTGLMAFAAGTFKHLDVWLLDTGANMHICNNEKWFSNLRKFDMTIDTADGQGPSLHVEGGGTVHLPLKLPDGRTKVLKLRNVAFAPSGRCNLLSHGILTVDESCIGVIDKNKAVLRAGNEHIGVADMLDGLYHLRLAGTELETPENPTAALINLDDPVMKMHRRLGHLSFQNMRILNKVSKGMGLTDEQIRGKLKMICPICATTKATVATPRDPASRRADTVGEMLHVDTWGPYAMPGYDDTVRYLFITDDATRFTWAERLKPGDSPIQKVKDLHTYIERAHKATIRAYRFDGEFNTTEMISWLRKKGIRWELTQPYAHYQNGSAERANRTIRDKAAPMIQEQSIARKISNIVVNTGTEYLRESSVPENLWPEAMEYAVWLKNRSPSRALRKKEKKTPWEALYNLQPEIDRERVWGSRTYVTLPTETQGSKLHTPRGWVGYFVGLASEATYRIWNPEKHKVYKIGMARVDDSEGLDDAHSSPAYRDRVTVADVDVDAAIEAGETADLMPPDETDDESETEESEYTGEQILDNEDEANDTTLEDTGCVGQQTTDNESEADGITMEDNGTTEQQTSQPEQSSEAESDVILSDKENTVVDINNTQTSRSGTKEQSTSKQITNTETTNTHHIEPISSPVTDQGNDLFLSSPSSTTSEEGPIVSKYFANMAEKKSWKLKDREGTLAPDPTKCSTCWLRKRRCDRDIVGIPCTACKGQFKCRDQTKEEQELYTDPKKPIKLKGITPVTREGPPCRHCYIGGKICYEGSDPKKCKHCESCGVGCNPNLEGAKPRGRWAKAKGEKKIEPCYRCQKKQSKCDGKRPCNHCTGPKTRKTCMSVKEREVTKIEARCNGCERSGMSCDRKRPCNTCKEARSNCYYDDQDGMVTRGYPVAGAPSHNWTKMNVQGSQDLGEAWLDGECVRCYHYKLNCDKGEPCWQCVKHAKGMTNTCVYVTEQGVKEMWDITRFKIEGDKMVIKEQDESESEIKAKGTKPRKKQKYEKKGIMKKLPPAEASLYDMLGPRYVVVNVSGEGDLCGRRAILTSFQYQYPAIQPRIVEADIDAALEDEDYQEFANLTGTTNENNFSEDQLAFMVGHIGRTKWEKEIKLGVFVKGQGPHIVWPTEYNPAKDLVLWIHNDNNEQETEDTGKGHWTAMTRGAVAKGGVEKGKGIKWIVTQQLEDGEDNGESQTNNSDDSDEEEDRITKEKAIVDDDLNDFIQESYSHSKAKLNKLAMTVTVDYAKLPVPKTYTEARRAPDAEKFVTAEAAEKESLRKNNTFKIVPTPSGKKLVTSRFVYDRKLGPDGSISKYKARLVARGFQQVKGIDYSETFSPVVKTASFRILFAIAAIKGWKVYQLDVKTAFLNGELDEPVYMHPPQGWKLKKNHCLEVSKALYGLCQSPRAWYEKWRKTVEGIGFRVSAYDPCVFIHDKRQLYIGLWVDDVQLTGGIPPEIEIFRKEIAAIFEMTDEGMCSYFLGMHVEQGQEGISIHQQKYAEQVLGRYDTNLMPTSNTPLDTRKRLSKETKELASMELKDKYMSKIGSIMYLANGTRPDLAFAIGYTSRYSSNPNQHHMDAVDRILGYLKHTKRVGIQYKKGNGFDLSGYADSDFGNCPDTRKSSGGWIFMLAGAPISWSAKRQSTVALSTLDAEYIAACEATREAVWIKGFINDLKVDNMHVSKVPLYIDNNGAYKLSKNPEFHNRTKHIDIKYHYIREKVVDTCDIETRPIGTRENIADILTKALSREVQERLMAQMGLTGMSKPINTKPEKGIGQDKTIGEGKHIGADAQTKSNH